jgi:glycosyltransferase involved in cell wall biosynthesis
MARLKILQVQGQAAEGGAEVHTFLLSRGLIGRGHEVYLAAPDTPSTAITRAEAAGCHLHRFSPVPTWRGILDYGTGRRLARLVREEGIELIHSHLWYGDVIAAVASVLTSVPVVTTLHGPYIPITIERRPIHDVHRLLYRGVLTRMQRIIAISGFVKDLAVCDLRLRPGAIDVVHNCSDVSLYQQDRDTEATRSALGLEPEHVVVSIVGELTQRKGILAFVDVAARIARECPDARFLLVGDGPLRDQAEASARAQGCDNAMVFAGWRKDIPELMAASDILAVTSYKEGFGRTITEAMSSAIPVISFDSGAPREIIVHGETGYLVPEGDVEQFAGFGVRLIADAALRRRLGEAGLARARAEFDIPPFVEKTEKILREAVGERQRSA